MVWRTNSDRGKCLSTWRRRLRGELFLSCALALLGASGCGGDDGSGDAPARKPDTGYGAAQMTPSAQTCTDLCARAADCAAHLCNEDTHSTRYDALADILVGSCEAQCTDATVSSKITADQWQCLFASSCRQAFDYDTCRTGSSYYCN